ncbi:GNAT family N-acetyltransferase [Virgibacillus ihumii]|uniref:GNAT family N-acetyltransferase n=1 Tax=Virgibacillus ihumii TaxID=2686091 RepID=UPI00157DE1A1|nr:GNAT family N-acetyltransferase [Virgibacillus ihumii]
MMLSTERLILRPYEDKDMDFLMSMLSDPEMVRFIGNGKIKDEIGAKQFMDWIYSAYEYGSEFGLHVMVLKGEDAPIGHAGLVPQQVEERNEIEIGYWVKRPYWGQGYATEIAAALKNFGLQELAEQRLIALVQPGNVGSQKVAEKIGMKIENQIKLSGQDVFFYTVGESV